MRVAIGAPNSGCIHSNCLECAIEFAVRYTKGEGKMCTGSKPLVNEDADSADHDSF